MWITILLAIIAIGMHLPQIIKSIKTKSTDDIALSGQLICALNITLYCLYYIIYNHDYALLAVSILEAVFIYVNIFCTIKYRKSNSE